MRSIGGHHAHAVDSIVVVEKRNLQSVILEQLHDVARRAYSNERPIHLVRPTTSNAPLTKRRVLTEIPQRTPLPQTPSTPPLLRPSA